MLFLLHFVLLLEIQGKTTSFLILYKPDCPLGHISNFHCCFNPTPRSGHYMDVSCGQSTAFLKFYDNSSC
ncbi:unnamed protein product, partial [Bubo scandiacus]